LVYDEDEIDFLRIGWGLLFFEHEKRLLEIYAKKLKRVATNCTNGHELNKNCNLERWFEIETKDVMKQNLNPDSYREDCKNATMSRLLVSQKCFC
jgi:hypothetical protein